MTVFNYYGSKGGLLLSLVAESDRHPIRKIDGILEADQADSISTVTAFSLTVINDAFSYLDRQTWGHVLATSILEGNSRGFAAMEQQLRDLLTQLLERLKEQKLVASRCDCRNAETIIYNVHNARFIEFSSDSDVSRKVTDALIIQGLGFVVEHIS